MKHIKSYKIFESKDLDLEQELKNYNIENYTINEDGSIDVDGDTSLSKLSLSDIPFKFNKVNGNFYIYGNSLTTLKNCAKYVNGGFSCCQNELVSLEYGPEYVGRNYVCFDNQLTTLKGCVDEVYGNFICNNNKLTSLEFCPMQVEGWFNCSDNLLIELDRSPFIREYLDCSGNLFKSKPDFNGHCKKLIWE